LFRAYVGDDASYQRQHSRYDAALIATEIVTPRDKEQQPATDERHQKNSFHNCDFEKPTHVGSLEIVEWLTL
jgi:hypothetical protein